MCMCMGYMCMVYKWDIYIWYSYVYGIYVYGIYVWMGHIYQENAAKLEVAAANRVASAGVGHQVNKKILTRRPHALQTSLQTLANKRTLPLSRHETSRGTRRPFGS
jgi:hypothetical protein